ncbi:hypothetical protein [Desulfosporosinus hippei]|uniref:Uncharacterized protein n=1 Tax=Desulfosporosinus hippei DSM 8344 TaxID=1121419 RepID=A0A1G8CI08_9FIRM|nr:hypothetical protein [Desulfosporosinus hippei]SDH45009.1 hypothetical protein SAMN05443529_113105 [Desulfosporosinus hippei DSM 8344]
MSLYWEVTEDYLLQIEKLDKSDPEYTFKVMMLHQEMEEYVKENMHCRGSYHRYE